MVDKKSYTAADDCEVEEMRWTVSNHLSKSLHIKTKVLKQKSPDKPNFSLKKKTKSYKAVYYYYEEYRLYCRNKSSWQW